MKRLHTRLSATIGFALFAMPAFAVVPETYPATYSEIVAGAKAEGKLSIYSTTDERNADILLDKFKEEYPEIEIEYFNLGSSELYSRVVSEKAAGLATVDVVWTGSTDTALQMAKDGYAVEYASPEASALPPWANWKNLAYGTTFEPYVFGYNKNLLPPEAVPKNHQDLIRILTENKDLFNGKVGMSDPRGGTFSLTWGLYDEIYNPKYWDLVKAFGAVDMKYSAAGLQIDRLSAGELLLGYNLQISYMAGANDPNIGMSVPDDYIITASRTAFVSADAPHPNSAKLFLDFLLSHRGQTLIANEAKLFSIRTDVEGEYTYNKLNAQYGDILKPLPMSEELLSVAQNPERRAKFIEKFNEMLTAGAAP